MKKIAGYGLVGLAVYVAAFLVLNPFDKEEKAQGAAALSAGGRTMTGLVADCFRNIKDRFVSNYKPPSSKTDGNERLAKALVGLVEAIREPKQGAD